MMSDYDTIPIPTDYDLFADIYDEEYKDYHASVGDIEFYKSFSRSVTTPILDLCCGTGRIAIELAQAGSQVVGIDISSGMLSKAKAKTQALPEDDQKRLTFICADIRDYKLEMRFDFAYIGFRSFMLLLDVQDQEDALRNIISHLNPGGILVVSLFVPKIEKLTVYKTTSPEDCRYFGEFNHPNGRDRILEYEQKWCDEYRQVAVHKLRHVTVDEHGKELETRYRPLVIRWTHRFEFQHLARLCGFDIEKIYGDYFFKPFDQDSKEMIWVLKRGT